MPRMAKPPGEDGGLSEQVLAEEAKVRLRRKPLPTQSAQDSPGGHFHPKLKGDVVCNILVDGYYEPR